MGYVHEWIYGSFRTKVEGIKLRYNTKCYANFNVNKLQHVPHKCVWDTMGAQIFMPYGSTDHIHTKQLI